MIKTTIKKSQKIKYLVMGVLCLVSVAYGAWQVWSRIPERTSQFIIYRTAVQTFEELTELRVEKGVSLTPKQADAYLASEKILAQYKDEKPQPPSKYDRLINFWVWFIGGLSGLPFVAWPFWKYRSGGWTLDSEGMLKSPKGETFTSDEIIDIDMTTWRGLINPQASNKSTWQARLKLKDGRSLLLDDYLWEGLANIIAHYAHHFHPDAWDEHGEPLEAGIKEAGDKFQSDS
ncbi:MAG: hypothetical protein VX641_06365 [Planctomycetota bacterium]|nr:hypothetical protein [Planctomycetota bacterium]